MRVYDRSVNPTSRAVLTIRRTLGPNDCHEEAFHHGKGDQADRRCNNAKNRDELPAWHFSLPKEKMPNRDSDMGSERHGRPSWCQVRPHIAPMLTAVGAVFHGLEVTAKKLALSTARTTQFHTVPKARPD